VWNIDGVIDIVDKLSVTAQSSDGNISSPA